MFGNFAILPLNMVLLLSCFGVNVPIIAHVVALFDLHVDQSESLVFTPRHTVWIQVGVRCMKSLLAFFPYSNCGSIKNYSL